MNDTDPSISLTWQDRFFVCVDPNTEGNSSLATLVYTTKSEFE